MRSRIGTTLAEIDGEWDNYSCHVGNPLTTPPVAFLGVSRPTGPRSQPAGHASFGKSWTGECTTCDAFRCLAGKASLHTDNLRLAKVSCPLGKRHDCSW